MLPSEHRLMNNNRTHSYARRLHNFGIEFFGQHEIKLYRPALPFVAILIRNHRPHSKSAP